MENTRPGKIIITRNGPYKVTNNIPLNKAVIICDDAGDSETWRMEDTCVAEEGDYYLCRCGMSATKPFCDASHYATEFRGLETADRPSYAENARLLRGPGMDLLDDESLCVGARFCDKDGNIWHQTRESDTPENQRRVVEEACKCPGGRLTAVTKDGTMVEPQLSREISLVEDPANDCRGPLWVKGGIPIEGEKGESYERRNRTALCRCGTSANMPYCDGAHYDCPHMRGLDT